MGFLVALFILNKTTDIKSNIKPKIVDPRATRVEGIEKYLVSLNIAITTTEYIIPIISKTRPGNPRYFRGCLIAINSIKEATTPVECETGFLVEVFDYDSMNRLRDFFLLDP